MDNGAIADIFSLLSKLMDINGENSFRTKTYSIAAYNIERLPVQLKEMDAAAIIATKGIGDSVGNKIVEILETGQLQVLQDYIQKIPPGVIEMLQIKGIGPKKIHTIWKTMEIESIGELLYACNENRLTLYKGFGAKTQQNIQESIDFYLQNQGSFLYAQLEAVYPQVLAYLQQLFGKQQVAAAGAWRRQLPVIDHLSFVVNVAVSKIKQAFLTAFPPELLEETPAYLVYQLKNGVKLQLWLANGNKTTLQFIQSASSEFIAAFNTKYASFEFPETDSDDDAVVFEKVKLPYIVPALRETAGIIERAAANELPVLIEPKDIKGIIHNHSTWSDGANTLEEMARACIAGGFEYLVISDHSKSATYANGLTVDRIKEQHIAIDALNEKLAPFKIFKSIECDILNDGQLDYTDEVLSTFDLVVASVHSNLKMSQEKAMQRILKAVMHPATTILGHPTGRLLLSRGGYPIDYDVLFAACADHGVAIEINAHPRRLDLDWQWIEKARNAGVLLSINPDAHNIQGIQDVRYGVLAAQKGGLTASGNLSSMSLPEFEQYLQKQKRC